MGSRPRTAGRGARRLLLVASIVAAIGASALHTPVALAAEPLVIEGTSTATSDLLPSIRSGDTFSWTLTLDPDSLTTELEDPWSRFNDAVLSFTLSAGGGNSGDWDPSGATWAIAPAFNVVGNANGDNLTIQLQSPDAPDIAGRPFFDVSISLGWTPADLDMVWPTGPGTLAAFLGTATPPLQRATPSFELRNADYDAASFSSTLTSDRRDGEDDGGRDDDVPVPAAVPSGRADAGAPWRDEPSGAVALLVLVVGLAAPRTAGRRGGRNGLGLVEGDLSGS